MDSVSTLASVLDWVGRIVTVAALVGTFGRWIYKRHQRHVIERFFGGTSVTTYFPLRILEERSAIAEADFVAAHQLSAFLAKYRISVNFKFVDPTGRLDLTDSGIVAICGPKSSNLVKRALQRDDKITFKQVEGNHYALIDHVTQTCYASPRDSKQEEKDVGYLARNQIAPGSETTFISIAGIHAEGSAIVVAHLCNYRNLRSLYRATKSSLFSCVIGGEYRPDPLTVTSSARLALHTRAFRPATAADVADVSPNVPDQSTPTEDHGELDDCQNPDDSQRKGEPPQAN